MIKIKKENAEKVELKLKSINGRSVARVFDTFSEIQELADEAEADLEKMGLPKSQRRGARVVAVSSEKVSSSYRYSRDGTVVGIYRRPGGWYLESAESTTLWPSDGGSRNLHLSDEQISKALIKMAEGFGFDCAARKFCRERGVENV